MNNTQVALSLDDAYSVVNSLQTEIKKFVFGQEDLIRESLCCFLAGGHILFTGVPGLAKTTLVKVFAHLLNMKFGRVQFTPDLLPSDIIGSDVLNVDPKSGIKVFEFSKGPVFVNLLLADEINRASPRTQSALLEAMQERTCTVGGQTHQLPTPFMVFATQNPIESEGTFALPEAELDRFLLHSFVEYPSLDAEKSILSEHSFGKLFGESNQLVQGREKSALHLETTQINALISRVSQIQIDDELLSVTLDLVRSTRPEDDSCPEDLSKYIRYGVSPRAGISLISTSRALALLEQSESVRWKHLKRLLKPVLRHRIKLSTLARRDNLSEDNLIDKLTERLESKYKNILVNT